jgi:hypothetical protein
VGPEGHQGPRLTCLAALLLSGCVVGHARATVARPARGADIEENRIDVPIEKSALFKLSNTLPVDSSAVLRTVDSEQICFAVLLHGQDGEPVDWHAAVFNDGDVRQELTWTPVRCTDRLAPWICNVAPPGKHAQGGTLCVANNGMVKPDSRGVVLEVGSTFFSWQFLWTFGEAAPAQAPPHSQ